MNMKKKAEKRQMPIITLQTLAERFLHDYNINHRANSFRLTRRNLTAYILPYLGNYKLVSLTPAIIRDWQNEIKLKNLSDSTKNSINNTMRAFIKFGVNYFDVPAKILLSIKPMGQTAIKTSVLSLADWNKLYKVIDSPYYKSLFSLLFWCGLRIGEAMAIQLLDIDFINSTVKIEKQFLADEKRLAPLKTEKSKRLISIPGHVMEIIQEYLSSFHTVPALPFALKTSRGISWKLAQYCNKANIKPISPHVLRHSHATLLINNNIPAPVIAERLGHTTTTTTLRVYAHAYSDADKKVATFLDSLT